MKPPLDTNDPRSADIYLIQNKCILHKGASQQLTYIHAAVPIPLLVSLSLPNNSILHK